MYKSPVLNFFVFVVNRNTLYYWKKNLKKNLLHIFINTVLENFIT